MQKRIKLLFDDGNPTMFRRNAENLEKIKSELFNRGIGMIENKCEVVYDSVNENEVFALLDKILLTNNL